MTRGRAYFTAFCVGVVAWLVIVVIAVGAL
jgi:hypothetical protein